MKQTMRILSSAVTVMLALSMTASGQTIQWTRQFGTTSDDEADAVAVDATGVYVMGCSGGLLPGQTSGGRFVRKYAAKGNELWTRQFGPRYWVGCVLRAAVYDTGVYVVGSTDVALPGQTASGDSDVFVRKYDANGNELWTRQFGTASLDAPEGVAVDATGVYIAGWTRGTLPDQTSAGGEDAFVRKYDANGNELWTRQLGTEANDYAYGVAVDDTGVYVVGITTGTLPGQTRSGRSGEAFVRKYDSGGTELWTRQFGSTHEVFVMESTTATGVAVDATGVYVVGITTGALPGQTSAGPYSNDVFVRKYDASGTELWTRQFGSRSNDYPEGVAVDATGVYVAGFTTGTLPGQTKAGEEDAIVRKYDGSGDEQWTLQFGPTRSTLHARALGLATDATGVYLVGYTDGALPGQTSSGGFSDAFLMKLATGLTSVSAASYTKNGPLAPETIASVSGATLVSTIEIAPATEPLPTVLAQTSVKVRDSAGAEHTAPLWFVSPSQIIYHIPEQTALGLATINVVRDSQTVASGPLQIERVAPGLFTMNANGQGVPAALAISAKRDGSQTWQYVFNTGCAVGACQPVPLDLGAVTDQVFLQLYGTGLRGRSSLAAVTAKIGDVDAQVDYAGPVTDFAGLDQVNLLVPRGLIGRGEVDVALTVDGKAANTVRVNIK